MYSCVYLLEHASAYIHLHIQNCIFTQTYIDMIVYANTTNSHPNTHIRTLTHRHIYAYTYVYSYSYNHIHIIIYDTKCAFLTLPLHYLYFSTLLLLLHNSSSLLKHELMFSIYTWVIGAFLALPLHHSYFTTLLLLLYNSSTLHRHEVLNLYMGDCVKRPVLVPPDTTPLSYYTCTVCLHFAISFTLSCLLLNALTRATRH